MTGKPRFFSVRQKCRMIRTREPRCPARPPRNCAHSGPGSTCMLLVDSFQVAGAVEEAVQLIQRADSLHSLQVFIGNLSPDCDGKDLRDFFRDYGVCNDAWVARKPPGFGFVWLNDERDAVPSLFSHVRLPRSLCLCSAPPPSSSLLSPPFCLCSAPLSVSHTGSTLVWPCCIPERPHLPFSPSDRRMPACPSST